jgi:integrase/recombinase XerD
MTKHNPNNERIKRQYFIYLKGAYGYSQATVDAVAKALARFETDTKCRDFKAYRPEQADAFKRRLEEQTNQATGKPLSKATMYATLAHLKRFFIWLAGQPGYKSRLKFSDADFFRLSNKDARVATAHRESRSPTMEQVLHVVSLMPCTTDEERRDRALVAFILLTGARDGAVASMKLRHVDLVEQSVFQDPRVVKTKNSKSFTSHFFPVGDEIKAIVEDWVTWLQVEKHWGLDDPLFPATQCQQDDSNQFQAAGLSRTGWQSTGPIRRIFREAFTQAGLPYFNPHSLRKTLTLFVQQRCTSAEQYKAWSQNLGHKGVLTTFLSYGEVSTGRQSEIMRQLASPGMDKSIDSGKTLAEEIRQLLDKAGA